MASTNAKLPLHLLPSYAAYLNQEELVWVCAERTAEGRRKPAMQGGHQLQDMANDPTLIKAFF
ncbi:MAG: hypothetical protein KA173_15860 [Rhodoferax sp.]|nr:hypothetical protein [Rhodoferax sp.]MBP7492708.1 hypothetical protein [Rhodoferax sp.]